MQSSFQELQAYWYGKLKESGFNDIEDGRPEPLLKRWSGISDFRLIDGKYGEMGYSLIDIQQRRSFPEALYSQEESFYYHPDFTLACQSVCSHWNHKLTAQTVFQIWECFIGGGSERKIAAYLNINHTAVHRTIASLREWMSVMNNEEVEPEKELTVIVRDFDGDNDTGMLFATWRNSLWYDVEREESQADKFFREATKKIKNILKHPDVIVRVACLKDDPNFIAGCSVIIKNNIEWVYVKIDYRERGIAKILTKGFETVSEPTTKIGKAITFNHDLKIKK